jgi:hypothetical protein
MKPTLSQVTEATLLGRWYGELRRYEEEFGLPELIDERVLTPEFALGTQLQLMQCFMELKQLVDAPIAPNPLPEPPAPWRAQGSFGDGEVWQARWQGGSWRVIRTMGRQLDGRAWAHVSVSRQGQDRLPTWPEMSAIKEAFLGLELGAIQVHPPASKHVSLGEVLHLWAPLEGHWPLPDFTMGGMSI